MSNSSKHLESKKKKTATDGSHLDTREIEVFEQLDSKVQEKWRRQRSLKAALLGYAKLDILTQKDQLVFGTWNKRPLNDTQVQRLVESFRNEGLERFDLNTLIPIVIPKAVVDTSSLILTTDDLDKLPQFALVDTAPPNTPIKCAGGRHRLAAAEEYIAAIGCQLEQVQEERKKIATMPQDELTEQDIQRFNRELPADIKRLGGIKKYGGQWMVAVYDEDLILKDGLELAQHLSRNESRHIYMETEEERVVMEIQYMATITAEKRDARLKELRSSGIQKKANKLVALLNSDPAFIATEILVNHGAHFLEMSEMNVRWLHRHLCGIHGGLMCAAISAMAAKLDMCFSDVLVEMSAVDRLIKQRNNQTEDLDSTFSEFYQQLRDGKKTNLTVIPKLLDAVDNAWQTHVTKSAAEAFGCVNDDDYISAYASYVEDACTALKQYVQSSDIRAEVPVNQHKILDSIPAKFKFLMIYDGTANHGLPVLTQSPLRALARHLEKIPEALKEISRWCDPLVDYQVAFSKIANISYTQAAIAALANHDRIKRGAIVEPLLLDAVLQTYGACLQLEVQMANVLHTQRASSSKEVALLFPQEKKIDMPTAEGVANEVTDVQLSKLRKKAASTAVEENSAVLAVKAELSRLQADVGKLERAMSLAVRKREPLLCKGKQSSEIQGFNLVYHTSWPWRSIVANSRSREYHNIAAVAVLEWGVIEEYRSTLLQSHSNGASTIRRALENVLVTQMLSRNFIMSRSVDTTKHFPFPDQLHLGSDSDSSSAVEDLAIQRGIRDLDTMFAKRSDTAAVQSLVKAIERCPLAWQDPYNEEDSKAPRLHGEVQVALVKLVNVLQINAYRKRSGTDDVSIEDAEDADTQAEINLGIAIRGEQEATIIPKGKGTAKFKSKKSKISSQMVLVPTKPTRTAEDLRFEDEGDQEPRMSGKDSGESKDGKSHNPDQPDKLRSSLKRGRPLEPSPDMSQKKLRLLPSNKGGRQFDQS